MVGMVGMVGMAAGRVALRWRTSREVWKSAISMAGETFTWPCAETRSSKYLTEDSTAVSATVKTWRWLCRSQIESVSGIASASSGSSRCCAPSQWQRSNALRVSLLNIEDA